MNFTLLVVVVLTAIAFVGIVIALSNAIAPRSVQCTEDGAVRVGTDPAVNGASVSGRLLSVCHLVPDV